jgi:YVTN family beta-propeller protein
MDSAAGLTDVKPGSNSADAATPNRSERRYEFVRRRGSTLLWVGIPVGIGLLVAGLVWSRHAAGGCGGLNLAMQLSGSETNLKWMLLRCYTGAHPLGPVSTWELFFADLPVIAGYWLIGTLVLAAGWWRYEATALRRATWVVRLPSFLAVADLLEDGLMLLLVYYGPDGQLHVRSGSPVESILQWLLVSAASLKWMLAGATALAVVMAVAVWISRRDQHPNFLPGLGDTNRSPDSRAATTPTVQDSAESTTTENTENTEDPARFADTRRRLDWPETTDDQELMQLRADTGAPELKDTNGDSDELAPAAISPTPEHEAAPPTVGICVSGGGIRAAAFALGVLTELENASVEDGRPATESARFLTAVSGGAWAATVWSLQKVRYPTKHAGNAVIAGLTAGAPDSGYQRQKYLLNRRGGIVPAVAYMLACTATNVLLIASLIYVIAWPLGWFLGRRPISGGGFGEQCPDSTGIPDPTQLLHPAYLLVAGALLFVIFYCGLGGRSRARRWPIAAILLGIAAFSAVYLVGLPKLFGYLHCHQHIVDALGSFAGTSAFGAGIGGTLWKLFGGPLVHQVTGRIAKAAPRLLGIVVAIAAGAWAVLVMYKAAVEPRWDWWTPLLALILILWAYQFTSPNWPTLHNIFSDRLRRSFDPVAHPFPADRGRPKFTTGTWDELGRHSKPRPKGVVPELILCCAQQRNGIAAGGLRAETFTISPNWVRQGGRSVRTTRYLAAAKAVKRGDQPEFRDIGDVSNWLATTGAAFSSAMGRMSLGSTNALLATLNADLGIWLPNVRLLQVVDKARRERAAAERDSPPGNGDPVVTDNTHTATGHTDSNSSAEWAEALADLTDAKLFPRPRFGYLLKEILGWYSRDDRFVFITDGGHWDNLGIVELLRRDCDVIYCIDASADDPGSFTTLRQALALASLELDGIADGPVDIDHYLRDMIPTSHNSPLTIAANLTIPRGCRSSAQVKSVDPRTPITVHYTKLQATQDMDKDLRRYAISDPTFPMYSTLRQFLSPLQFGNLVEIGRFAGQKMVQLDAVVPDPPEASQGGPSALARPVTKPGVSNPSARIPIGKLLPDAVFPIGGTPDWLAIDEHVWVSNAPTNSVSQLDPATNTVSATITVGKEPGCGLAAGFGSLWVPNCGDSTMSRIDLATATVTATFPMTFADSEGGIATGAGSVWVLTDEHGSLARIDPTTNSTVAEIRVAPGSFAAAFGDGSVFVTSTLHSVVTRVDPHTNAVIATINVGPNPRFLAIGDGSLWTLNQGDGSITRADLATDNVIATIDAGIPGGGGEIAVGEGSVWATSFAFPITRIDPHNNTVVQQFFGDGGDAIRVGRGSVWLSNLRAGNVWRIDPRRITALRAD